MELILFLIILYFICKLFTKKKKKKNQRNVSHTKSSTKSSTIEYSEADSLLQQAEKRKQLDKQYKAVVEKHMKNEEKINQLYSIAIKDENKDSAIMQKVISMCIEDIQLAPDVIQYNKKVDLLQFGGLYQSNYFSSFKRLAIIYEKQKQYQKAIDICDQAISLDATNDGTDRGMNGRRERLQKKVLTDSANQRKAV